MLWDPVRLMPNPTKHQTHISHPSSTLKSSCLFPQAARMTWRTPDQTPITCRAALPLRHLGLTTPTRRPGHPSLYQCLVSKHDLSPHCNPGSVLHMVIVSCCCSSRP